LIAEGSLARWRHIIVGTDLAHGGFRIFQITRFVQRDLERDENRKALDFLAASTALDH
jgi:hypothetical protein